MTTIDIDHLLQHEEIQQLLDASEQIGVIRAVELAELVETHELDALEQDALFRELEQRGIDVVEGAKPEEPAPAACAGRPRSRRRPTRSSSSCARPAVISS